MRRLDRRSRWRLLVWRPIIAYPWAYLAMVAALALGVAMMLAVEVINTAALMRFGAGVRRLSGGIDGQVVPRMGALRDTDLTVLRGLPGVHRAAPVLRGRVTIAAGEHHQPIDWLGLDLLAQALSELLASDVVETDVLLTPDKSRLRSRLFAQGGVKAEDYSERGSTLHIRMPRADLLKLLAAEGEKLENLSLGNL